MNKKSLIISAFPACGKTYLTENQNMFTFESDKKYTFVDSESSKYEKYPGWEKNYVDDIKKKIGTVDFIFICQYEEVLRELKNRNIPFVTVCPCGDKECCPEKTREAIKQQWFGRMVLRDNRHIKNLNEWLNTMKENYDKWTTIKHITKYGPVNYYFLFEGQYLSDIIDGLYWKKENDSRYVL